MSSRTAGSPSISQLAEYLEVSVEKVIEGLEAAGSHHAGSLDAPRGELHGESRTLAEPLGEEGERIELVDARITVASAARQLSACDREVLRLRFELDLTQTEIAARIGVSQMQVSRILRRGFCQLRELTAVDEGLSATPPQRQAVGV